MLSFIVVKEFKLKFVDREMKHSGVERPTLTDGS